MTEEELGRLINAAQRYDHEHRLRGHGWTRVSDQQAARLILGALGAMAAAANPTQPNGDDRDDSPFGDLATEIRERGEPYQDGATLRHTATGVRVACRECGELPSPDLMGWSSDWLTLCQDARRHALGEGHQVAVSRWLGAIYGPVAESAGGGSETGRDQAPQAAEEAPAAPGEV